MLLGNLGDRHADARLLNAIVLRKGRVGEWLRIREVDAVAIETAFANSGWGA